MWRLSLLSSAGVEAVVVVAEKDEDDTAYAGW